MLQDSATPKMVRNVIDGTTPPQKVVGSYEQLEDGTYNLIIGLTGDAPTAAAISQINGEDLAGKEFYDYVRTVGAVLFSFNPDFSPAARYGGSWENITDRFLVGAGGSYSLGSTGGSAEVALTAENNGAHSHDLHVYVNGSGGVFSDNLTTTVYNSSYLKYDTGGAGILFAPGSLDKVLDTKLLGDAISAGSGTPFSILPPYIAVNIWRRVA